MLSVVSDTVCTVFYHIVQLLVFAYSWQQYLHHTIQVKKLFKHTWLAGQILQSRSITGEACWFAFLVLGMMMITLWYIN